MSSKEEKDKIIDTIYYSQDGYGSMMTTYKDARIKDSTITIKYVQGWFNENIEKKAQPVGTNSFVAPQSNYEYQLDLCFFADLENQKFKVACVCIDIFSKYARVVPIMSRLKGDVAAGLIQCLHEMRHKPSILYTDAEPSLESPVIRDYLRQQKIKHYITRNHAAFAERFIRTFKALLYKRIDSTRNKKKKDEDEDPQWTDYLHEVLITYNFKMVHSSTKMTPADALKDSSRVDVKANLELRAKRNRKYPTLNVNDNVKILRKKLVNEKERQVPWSEETYKVSVITEQFGQKYYKVEGSDRDYIRGELLKM